MSTARVPTLKPDEAEQLIITPAAGVRVAASQVTDGGRGVFATKAFAEGETVEIVCDRTRVELRTRVATCKHAIIPTALGRRRPSSS